jgi:prevent-host-death family protein
MRSVNIRELTHHFSSYLKKVKSGTRIIILERGKPIADIIPHQANIASPGWRRKIQRIKVKGESFSETVSKSRAEER